MKSKKYIKFAALLLSAAIVSCELYGTGSLVYAQNQGISDRIPSGASQDAHMVISQETEKKEESNTTTTKNKIEDLEESSKEKEDTEAKEESSKEKEDTETKEESSKEKEDTEAKEEPSKEKEDTETKEESSKEKEDTEAKEEPSKEKEDTETKEEPSKEKEDTEVSEESSDKKENTEIPEESSEQKEISKDKQRIQTTEEEEIRDTLQTDKSIEEEKTELLGEYTEEAEKAMEHTSVEAFTKLLKDYEMYGVLANEMEVPIYQEASETATVIATLVSGHQVKFKDVVFTDKNVWFQVEFAVNDAVNTGFVQSDFVVSEDERLIEWKSKYLNATNREISRINALGKTNLSIFPQNYQPFIQSMMLAHPNWTFVPMNTGLEWSEVVKNEMVNARNLVETYQPDSWKSKAPEDYNAATGEWIIKNGTNWVQASEVIVKHYLDPRNFLNEESIFQFEQLTYNSNHTEAGVEKILSGCFMSHKKLEDGSGGGITYAQAFMKIGKKLKVSPYFLASRVRQEQGTNGTSKLISGTYPGYKGYYNYFNRHATGIGEEVIISGLTEAKNNGWNTRYKALEGGAESVASDYIKKGQDTFYLQKFDVESSYYGLYWHQYMQNLLAADNEGKRVQKSYSSMGLLKNSFVFKIPVYNNMPLAPCPKPGKKLDKPVLAASKNGYTSTQLYWVKIDGVQGYQVYRKEASEDKYTRIKTLNGADAVSFKDKTIIPGKKYTYRVRAFTKTATGNVYSPYSDVRTVNYTIASTSWEKFHVKNYTKVELSWKKASVTGYKIYRKTGNEKYKCIKTIKDNKILSFTDTTAAPGNTYTYRIRGYRTVNDKDYYSAYTSVKKTDIKMATAQLNKVVVSEGNKVKLSWKRDSKTSGYYVYRATSEKGKYSKVKTINSNKTLSWTDNNVSTGVTYYYKIRSFVKTKTGTKTSKYSKILMVKPVIAKPAVTSIAATENGVKLRWRASQNAGGYKVYRADSYTGKYKEVKKITKNATLSWTDKNVKLGKTYYYKVRAYSENKGKLKYSSYSTIVCAQPSLSDTKFTEISDISTTKVTLKWKKLTNVDGYQLYRKTGKSGKYKSIKNISKSSTTKFVDSGLKRKTIYYYKIRSYKKINGKIKYSKYSEEWCVQTK